MEIRICALLFERLSLMEGSRVNDRKTNHVRNDALKRLNDVRLRELAYDWFHKDRCIPTLPQGQSDLLNHWTAQEVTYKPPSPASTSSDSWTRLEAFLETNKPKDPSR
jgi:hypothetical protein